MAIRVIVAGVGVRGQNWIREVRANPAFELSALVDPDQETLRDASGSFVIPAADCFKDLEEALDQKECDAVIIASSPDRHVQVCELALSRQAAVMVEKPFTMALREAVRLVSLAEQQSVPLMVAQNHRYLRSFRTARRLIAEGVLGRIGMVVCQYYRVPHPMVASLSCLPHRILWGVGVHHLDALRYILGQNIERVMAEDQSGRGIRGCGMGCARCDSRPPSNWSRRDR
jgi:predicted dehydrogenase